MNRRDIERLQIEKLSGLLREVRARNPFYSRKLQAAGWEPGDLEKIDGKGATGNRLEALLDGLPLTTKEELQRDQEETPPYGTNLTFPLETYQRLHQTSGTTGRPLRWLDTARSWEWWLDCWETIYSAAGVTSADRVFVPFSFGPFVGFWSAFEGAFRRGCFVLPAGGLRTSNRLSLLADNRMTVLVATPSYALHMAEVAAGDGVELAESSIRAVIVAGEPGGSIPSTKERIEKAWGARCFDHCGMTEVGAFGYERIDEPGRLYLNEAEFVGEVFRPGTAERAADGEEAELVVTNLGRAGTPVIRYRTGDLVRVRREDSAGADAFFRLDGGILARLDDMAIIRGNNVYPSAIEGVLRRFSEVAEFRIRVTKTDELSNLVVEIEPEDGSKQGADEDLRKRIRAALERALLFRVRVELVPPASLPRFELKARRFIREDVACASDAPGDGRAGRS